MRNVDFAPLSRSTVGFDRMFNLFEDALRRDAPDGYPPYNIAKTGEDSYRIDLAVAGFTADEIAITAQQNLLIVAGRKAEAPAAQYVFQGIAARSFERRFNLADHIKVAAARLENGMLAIELVREVPEAMKPRRIVIGGASAIDQKAA